MKTIKFFLTALILGITLASCSKQEDDDEDETINNSTTPTTSATPTTEGLVYYHIYTNGSDMGGGIMEYNTAATTFTRLIYDLEAETTAKPLYYKVYAGNSSNPKSTSIAIHYYTTTKVNDVIVSHTEGKTIIFGPNTPNGALSSTPKTGTFNW